jgi:hypothetical protein
VSRLAAYARDQAVDRVIYTIEAIVLSKAVVQYKTGITLDYKRRRNQYGGDATDPYPHFVVLESGLSAAAALHLEKMVHDVIVQSDGRSSMAKKRWEGGYRNYSPSLGGLNIGDDREYYFYLTWK